MSKMPRHCKIEIYIESKPQILGFKRYLRGREQRQNLFIVICYFRKKL